MLPGLSIISDQEEIEEEEEEEAKLHGALQHTVKQQRYLKKKVVKKSKSIWTEVWNSFWNLAEDEEEDCNAFFRQTRQQEFEAALKTSTAPNTPKLLRAEQRRKMSRVTYHLPDASDVLCGRSTAALKRVKSRRLRNLVTPVVLEEYIKTRHRATRSEIITSVMRQVGSEGGRFLKACADESGWVEMPKDETREKIGHALRDEAAKSRGKLGLPRKPRKRPIKSAKKDDSHSVSVSKLEVPDNIVSGAKAQEDKPKDKFLNGDLEARTDFNSINYSSVIEEMFCSSSKPQGSSNPQDAPFPLTNQTRRRVCMFIMPGLEDSMGQVWMEDGLINDYISWNSHF